MTLTAQHLHAIANLWSLHVIWPELVRASLISSESQDPDRGTIQAWRPGSGVHTGRTGNPVLDAITRGTTAARNHYATRIEHTQATFGWLTQQLGLTLVAEDRIPALIHTVPELRPSTALNVAMWAGAEDRAVRRLLGEGDDHQLLRGLPCPHCGTPGSLAIRTSNPTHDQRPIVCDATGCTCDGPACSCGHGSGAGALPHIWTNAQLTVLLNPSRAAA